jgi:hypothetical protein
MKKHTVMTRRAQRELVEKTVVWYDGLIGKEGT